MSVEKANLNWGTTRITARVEEDHLLGFGGELGRRQAHADGPVDGEIQGLREGLGRGRSPQEIGNEGESEEKHDGQEHALARAGVLVAGSIHG